MDIDLNNQPLDVNEHKLLECLLKRVYMSHKLIMLNSDEWERAHREDDENAMEGLNAYCRYEFLYDYINNLMGR